MVTWKRVPPAYVEEQTIELFIKVEFNAQACHYTQVPASHPIALGMLVKMLPHSPIPIKNVKALVAGVLAPKNRFAVNLTLAKNRSLITGIKICGLGVGAQITYQISFYLLNFRKWNVELVAFLLVEVFLINKPIG